MLAATDLAAPVAPALPPEPVADEVPEAYGCPKCSERRTDRLEIGEDDDMRCHSCGTRYSLRGFDAEIDLWLVTASVFEASVCGYRRPAVLLSAGFDANSRLLGAIAHRIASEAEVLTERRERWQMQVCDGTCCVELADGTEAETLRALAVLERAVAKVMPSEGRHAH